MSRKFSAALWGLSIVLALILAACSSSKPNTLIATSHPPTLTLSASASPTVEPTGTLTSSPTITTSPTKKILPVYTFYPTWTPSATKTPFRSKTPSPPTPPTPTPTPTQPYLHKQVLVEYARTGYLSIFDQLIIPRILDWVLYTDGQLIIDRSQIPIWTRQLSQDEVCWLLSELTRLGFYEIETNWKHDPTDLLYNFDSNFQQVYDANSIYLFVNGEKLKTVYVYEPFIDYVIPRMKQLLKFLDAYNPGHLTTYKPDQLLLRVEKRDTDSDQPTEVLPWPKGLPSLQKSLNEFIYLAGDEAAQAAEKAFSKAWEGVFSEGEKEYFVIAKVVFPDELIGDQNLEPTPFVMPFQCSP
jgi:hypothetical protein